MRANADSASSKKRSSSFVHALGVPIGGFGHFCRGAAENLSHDPSTIGRATEREPLQRGALGSSGLYALYASCHLCGPRIFHVGVLLFVQALGEAPRERRPFIGGFRGDEPRAIDPSYPVCTELLVGQDLPLEKKRLGHTLA